ncbi:MULTISPECIES: FAD-dependent oxidoreductase [unclassified Microbacterium]|uniref:FAD-dependent oxidoreductase n=1 Tax=unclassified Microbacterium TaxID=2609290 RepID=UPI000C2C3030|nr:MULTISPECIES: FAD-dependent oxidoreductase [unclassified Microbacterium]
MRDVTVIGAGIIGLTAALTLAERGHAVRVVAREIAEGTASAAAASLWSAPLVERTERARRWAYLTLARLRVDALDETAGVRDQLALAAGIVAGPPDPWMRAFAPPLRAAAPGELPPGTAAGTLSVMPLIDTAAYLPWLRARCAVAGIALEHGTVTSLAGFARPGDAVVVAVGAGAAALVGDDTLRPVRGQVVHLSNPGLTRTLVIRDGEFGPLFVVPRAADVVVGGPAQDGVWEPEADAALEQDLLRRARAVEPRLEDAAVLGRAVGHRPVRDTVRVEREDVGGARFVHCYGHGGAGVTLSWGCAADVADLVGAA